MLLVSVSLEMLLALLAGLSISNTSLEFTADCSRLDANGKSS